MSASGLVYVVGALNLDLVAQTEVLPRVGQTVLASALSRHAGGKGLNQAVAAARAGARVRMIGRVGRDEPGDWLLEVLQGAGADTARVARDLAAPTGQAFITVNHEGENMIVVAAGANLSLSAADCAPETISDASVLLAQLETALAPVAALLAAAPTGCLKVLNAAPALAPAKAMFPHCDVLIVNETELAGYAGLPAAPETERGLALAARGLRTRPEQAVVVTLGRDGALLVEGDALVRIPGRPAAAIDTVGAGDCFCGVFAAAAAEGLSLAAAATRANVAASIAVTRRGAAEAMPTSAEIETAIAG